jgi:hypothetical protein
MESVGEVTTAYVRKFYRNNDHIAIIDGGDVGKMVASGWTQISAEDYAKLRQMIFVIDLRSKVQ